VVRYNWQFNDGPSGLSAPTETTTPTVTKVTPAKGPASGGTVVTITGTDFTAASAVTFGSSTATSFTVKSSKSILALTPAAAATTVDVTVTTPAGTSATSLADHFRFGPPTITELTPNHGPTTGPTSVTVTGTGFALGAGATAFKLGTIPVTSVNCTSITSCKIVVPAHKAGSLDLRATVEKLVSPKVPADVFTYS
jgi:hypothetical protein